jgi:hypothetical protein
MNEKAPGPWLNLVNRNDFITFASTMLGSVGTAYLSQPPTTEEGIKKWLKLNSFYVSVEYDFSRSTRFGIMAN